MSATPPPAAPYQYQPPPPPPPGKDKGLGWTGFGLTLVVCVPCLPIVGLVIAIVALARRRFEPRWVAALTIVLGLGATALQIAMISPIVDGIREGLSDAVNDDITDEADRARRTGKPTEISSLALRKGDCFNDPGATISGKDAKDEAGLAEGTVVLLPCDRKHDLEVFTTVHVAGDEFPGDAAIDRKSNEYVKRFRGFVGKRYRDSVLDVIYYPPNKRSWRLLDDRTIVCAVGHSEHRVTGSLRGRKR